MLIASIDIGITHFALIISKINQNYDIEKLVTCKLIDIKNYNCNKNVCRFIEKKSLAHAMHHLFEKFHDEFEKVDTILVEKQPFCGLNPIEEIITFNYPYKVILQNPVDLHKFLGFRQSSKNKLNYEERKAAIIKMGNEDPMLSEMSAWKANQRLHDCGGKFIFLIIQKN